MKWIVIDGTNLASRCFAVMPPMTVNGEQTGAMYGYLKTVRRLVREFKPDAVAHCFDSGVPVRRSAFPNYKRGKEGVMWMEQGNRIQDKFLNGKHKRFRNKQILELYQTILPAIGYENVLVKDGVEADDLCAVAVRNHLVQKAIIATSDKDLYQCLKPSVSIYDFGKKNLFTAEDFRTKYGIGPETWAKVKAIGGCESDSIPGVPGVREKSALNYVTGKANSVVREKIENNKDVVARNMPLVSVPYAGTEDVSLRYDDVTADGWAWVAKNYEMKGLLDE